MTVLSRPLRVTAAITPHGFGHAAVMLAVLEALDQQAAIDVTFLTTIPEALLRTRWGRPCRVVVHGATTDFGMLMTSSTGIRVAESLTAYVQAHARWDAVVAEDAAVLVESAPDVVVSCISYATLAAAQKLAIPNIGLGPFTWREILSAYDDHSSAVAAVLATMKQVYGAADAMIATTPAIAMDLPNLRTVGPVGRPGRCRRVELGLDEGERVALVALGGIAEDLPRWPKVTGWRWLMPDEISMGVSDAIASVDAVITKPGYGTFVEAACAGAPLLYRDRPDWPETVGMVRWLSGHVPCLGVDAETFSTGRLENHLHMLMQARRGPLARPDGNHQAAEIIREFCPATARHISATGARRESP